LNTSDIQATPATSPVSKQPGTFLKGYDPRRVIPQGPKPSTLAARKLLQENIYQKVQDLLELSNAVAKDAPPCPLCQRGMPRSDSFRLSAILAIMDRAGFGPTAKLEVKHTTDDEWIDHLTPEQTEVIIGFREEARGRMMLEQNTIDVTPREATG